MKKLTRGRIIEVYVLAKAGAVLATPLSARRRYASMGIPLPSTQTAILDLSTQTPVPAGQVGHLYIHAAQMMRSYLREVTELLGAPMQQTLGQERWLGTGDLAWQDEEGFFYFADKLSDSCIKEQQLIYPHEIEELLREQLSVSQAMVVLDPDKRASQAVRAAFVVPALGHKVQEQALLDWLNQQLPPIKQAQSLYLVETLPRSRLSALKELHD